MAKFALLSYEFRGIPQPATPTLFNEFPPEVIEENFEKKQELFDKFFDKENFPQYFNYKGKQCKVELRWKYNGIIVFQLERKGWGLQSLNFKSNKIPNNPWVDIIVDNRDKRQLIAVRKNSNAFKYPHTVAQILEENISRWLGMNYGLVVSVKAQYESKAFWKIYQKYYLGSGIERLQFNFSFPNKDWITDKIEELKIFGKKRNGAVRLGLEAQKGSALNFERNEENEAIVNSCSGTGEDIIVKPRNHHIIHLAQETNPVEQEMSDSTLKKILSPDAEKQLFEENSLAPYERAGEFLNKCKDYYA